MINFIVDVWFRLNTPLKSICSGNTQKTIYFEAILFAKLQVVRLYFQWNIAPPEAKFEGKYHCKENWKGKNLMDALINLQRTENGLVLLPFPGNFYKLPG